MTFLFTHSVMLTQIRDIFKMKKFTQSRKSFSIQNNYSLGAEFCPYKRKCQTKKSEEETHPGRVSCVVSFFLLLINDVYLGIENIRTSPRGIQI